MRIAITGAGGFVGKALLHAARLRGHQTVALTRRDGAIRGADITARIDAIDDERSMRRAFDGADAVVHLAARVHVMSETAPDAAALYHAINVEGTRVALESAVAAGVNHFVSMSTAKVHGEGRARPYAETDALAPEGPYATSKRDAEELVAGAGSGISWTIVRPPLVYGPGVGGNFRRLLSLAQLGALVPLPLAAIRNRRSLVFVGNLADALLHVLAGGRAADQRYLVSDGEDLSTSDLLRRIGAALGARPMLFALPPGLLMGVLRTIGRGAEGDRLLDSYLVDSSRIRRETGWTAPFSVDEGLRLTVAWWRERRTTGAAS
jgi:nucleoside-diphosphate-sugar epimerase